MSPLDAVLARIPDPARRHEAQRLDRLFRDVTGWSPKIWQDRIIGYGQYSYRTKSGHEGTFLATGFAVRARDLSLHILPGYTFFPEIAARLGPHKHGKSCWYIKTLDAVNETALRDLVRAGLSNLAEHASIEPT
ncbi:MAG: DUF1801 domain-containing protein [Pseudomonadota bacterium]